MKQLLSTIALLVFMASCNTSNDAQSQSESQKANPDSILNTSKNELIYPANDEDISIYKSIIAYAKAQNLKDKTFAEIEIEIAKQLLNTPYLASTLEQEGEESLVINLRGLDCTTFLENVVAISFCVKSNNITFNDYCKMLTKLRYRNGKIDQYPSRLHYFTDWLLDNEKKGIIKIVSNDFGNADFNPTVGFMSKNPDKYRQLSNPEFVTEIARQEDVIARAKLKYITKDQIETVANKIKDGDLIAYITTINGLDISHVAIAAFKNNHLHFYHASLSRKKVVLSAEPMSEYLANMKKNDGILVARIVD